MKKKNRDNKIYKGSERYEEWTDSISDRERLEVTMWRFGGHVEKFSVTYLRKQKQRWIVIQRYDNAHFQKTGQLISRQPHCHLYGYLKGECYIQKLRGDPDILLTQAIETIKKRRKQLTEYYFRN